MVKPFFSELPEVKRSVTIIDRTDLKFPQYNKELNERIGWAVISVTMGAKEGEWEAGDWTLVVEPRSEEGYYSDQDETVKLPFIITLWDPWGTYSNIIRNKDGHLEHWM